MVRLSIHHGATVYLLEHRLPRIAAWNTSTTRNETQCLQHLQHCERNNVTYIARVLLLSKWTGRIRVIAPDGVSYKVHHTDVIRV